MRLTVVNDDIAVRMQQRLVALEAGRKITGTLPQAATALDAIARLWLYQATPYYVGLSTLVGLVDTELPSDEDLTDLNLVGDVAVFFGGDITVPLELVEQDDTLIEVGGRFDRAKGSDAEWTSADDTPPATVPAPLVTIAPATPAGMRCRPPCHTRRRFRRPGDVAHRAAREP